MASSSARENRYRTLIEKIFADRYRDGASEVAFERSDIERAAAELGIELPKNLGDVIYSVRYRTSLPVKVVATQPSGLEWVIEGRGRASYVFRLVPINRIFPNPELASTKIPDATPEIVAAHALSDEQALLAKVRYNRLIDIFLGLTTYSLQNHLRTTVRDLGQIEIDEIYVGVDKRGSQFVIPVQAKGGNDQLSVVQTRQDIRCCAEKFPTLVCRAVSTQFMSDDRIAMFELIVEGDHVRILDERHYRLVRADEIAPSDLAVYGGRA